MKQFRFIDLYAGIGGFRLPFEKFGGTCIFTSEWDKFARETYKANFKNKKNHIFAHDLSPYAEDPSKIPEHDVLLAGFPCQPFSNIGVGKKVSLGQSHGFLDPVKGTCFFDICKILDYHKTPMFVLENVKGLKGHNKGETFNVILKTLDDLGYDIKWKVISSEPWVPQKRERIFIVGHREQNDFSFDKMKVPKKHPKLGSILEGEVDPKYYLTREKWDHVKVRRKYPNPFHYILFSEDDVWNTLLSSYPSTYYYVYTKPIPRRLTPKECSRLMGFPECFKIPVSDSQAYKQFGNAVVPKVVKEIVKVMMTNA